MYMCILSVESTVAKSLTRQRIKGSNSLLLSPPFVYYVKRYIFISYYSVSDIRSNKNHRFFVTKVLEYCNNKAIAHRSVGLQSIKFHSFYFFLN